MKKLILALALTITSTQAFAARKSSSKVIDGVKYRVVEGEAALKGDGLNQFDDVQDPDQGFLVTLPTGYHISNVDVQGNGSSICSVTAYDYKTQTLKIDGLYLETDEPGCEVILTIYEKASKKYLKAVYAIGQAGT